MSASIGSKVWSILGEGEDREALISGSTAEAIDDAIAITIDVMQNKYYDWATYCKYKGLDPETGWEPEDAEDDDSRPGVTVQSKSVQDFLKEMDL